MWFAAYFEYDLDPEDHLREGTPLTLQEDLILLQAVDSEEAYEKALALGAEVSDFGQRLLEGDDRAFCELGIEGLSRFHPQNKDSDCPRPSILHPANVGLYRNFRFLGLKDLVPLHGEPGNGTEIDVRELVGNEDQFKAIGTSTQSFQAFSPAGAAYSDSSVVNENSKLFNRYHWYVAEELFKHAVGGSRETKITERFVLLNALSPDQALQRALDNAREFERATGLEYRGLRQLSLVTSDLQDGAELRSSIIMMPTSQISLHVKGKPDLKAFIRADR